MSNRLVFLVLAMLCLGNAGLGYRNGRIWLGRDKFSGESWGPSRDENPVGYWLAMAFCVVVGCSFLSTALLGT